MNKVSIKEFILDTIEETEPMIQSELPQLIKWGLKADQRVGSYYQYEKKIIVSTVVNCKVQIPCGGVYVRAILIGDYGCDCTEIIDYAIRVNSSTLTFTDDRGLNVTNIFYWSEGNPTFASVKWEVQGDTIVFETDMNGQLVTIQYLAYSLDGEGYPIVLESHEDAIVNYIKKKLVARKKWRVLAGGGNADRLQQEYMLLNKEYHRGVRYARGEDGRPTESQRQEIAEYMNDPISGYGNALMEPLYTCS